MKSLEHTLLVTDLDGTLLPSNKCLAPEDVEAIARFRASGGTFTIATGRTLQAAQTVSGIAPPDAPCILFNGAVIYDIAAKKMLDMTALPDEAIQITRSVLDAFPEVSAEILRPTQTYVSRMTEYEQMHLDICKVEPILMEPEEIPKGDWLKVLFAIAADQMPNLIAFFQKQAWDCADFVQSVAHFYEALPKGATKGSALQKYRKLCSMEGWRIVAAGDFDNDLEMLEEADNSACPSNAQPCVKEVADIQLVNSCDTHAIAELIDRIMED